MSSSLKRRVKHLLLRTLFKSRFDFQLSRTIKQWSRVSSILELEKKIVWRRSLLKPLLTRNVMLCITGSPLEDSDNRIAANGIVGSSLENYDKNSAIVTWRSIIVRYWIATYWTATFELFTRGFSPENSYNNGVIGSSLEDSDNKIAANDVIGSSLENYDNNGAIGFIVEVLTPDKQVPKIRFPWKIALHKSAMLLLLILVGLFSAGIMAVHPPVQAGSESVAEEGDFLVPEDIRDTINNKGHLIAADVELQSDCDKVLKELHAPAPTSFDAVSYKVHRKVEVKYYYLVKVFVGDRYQPNNNTDYRHLWIVKMDDEPFNATKLSGWKFVQSPKKEETFLPG